MATDGHPAAAEDSPGAATTLAAPVGEGPGTRIGPYKLLQLIGEGGFGSVFMAEQEKPVLRRVALKIIKLGMDTRQVIARFEAERQALAMMDHPNIAKVLDAGATDTGRPYFVMELVRGDPITAYCDTNATDTAERLRLFVLVCQAVQHAHQKGIIHRDIKPSNILVTVADGRPIPKVIDFGIAKATTTRLTDKTLFTEHRQLIGTPEYMSPEQAEMSGVDVDTRSDIYSLGVTLYELLTGSTPFDGRRLRESPHAEVQRIIREEVPPKPSTRLSSMKDTLTGVAARRHTEPAKLNRLIKGDLDWIAMKAMEKDRTRRYETASALGADVQRFLDREPVLAVPPSAAYRVRMFTRRHKTAVAVAAVAVVSLAAATAVSLAFAVQERAARAREAQQRELAERRQRETQQVADFQAAQLRDIDVRGMGVRLRADLLSEARAAMERSKLSAGEIDARREQLERLLAGLNLTNVALQQLDRDIFERVLKAAQEKFNDQPLVQAQFFQTMATSLRELGLLSQASAPQVQALSIRRKFLGDEHRDTLASLDNLGQLQQAQGKLADAERSFSESLAARRRTLGDDHAEALASLQHMGDLLMLEEKWGAAEPLSREALAARRRVLGDEHADTLTSMESTGQVLQALGKLDEAERLLRTTMETRRRLLGPDDPATLRAAKSLCEVIESEAVVMGAESFGRAPGETPPSAPSPAAKSRLAEAATLAQSTLDQMRHVLGDDHPDTMAMIQLVADILDHQDRIDEAAALAREHMERSRRVLGDAHPMTLLSIHGMGFFMQREGKPALAEPYFREAFERGRSVLGYSGVSAANSQWALGVVIRDQGRFAEAEGHLLAAEPVLGSKPQGIVISGHEQIIKDIVELYARWDRAEPGKGHDADAAAWKARLDALAPKSQPGH
jgi:hypothetical protein